MNITKIPFVKLVGIEKEKESLTLEYKKDLLNHLQTLFPELAGSVVPVLRNANIKYKKPATKKLTAYASVSDEMIEKFMDGFKRKNRASIVVDVELVDPDNTISSRSSFTWFVQKIN